MDINTVEPILEMLYGKELLVRPVDKVDLEKASPLLIGTFTDGEGTFAEGEANICGIAIFDMKFAAYASAALTMMPKGAAEDCVDEGEMSNVLSENLHEIFNVGVGLFGTDLDWRLKEVHHCPPKDKAPLLEIANGMNQRFDFHAELDNYGGGSITLFRNAD